MSTLFANIIQSCRLFHNFVWQWQWLSIIPKRYYEFGTACQSKVVHQRRGFQMSLWTQAYHNVSLNSLKQILLPWYVQVWTNWQFTDCKRKPVPSDTSDLRTYMANAVHCFCQGRHCCLQFLSSCCSSFLSMANNAVHCFCQVQTILFIIFCQVQTVLFIVSTNGR